jgi:hypothetical protein
MAEVTGLDAVRDGAGREQMRCRAAAAVMCGWAEVKRQWGI